jgi:hypothetical protein
MVDARDAEIVTDLFNDRLFKLLGQAEEPGAARYPAPLGRIARPAEILNRLAFPTVATSRIDRSLEKDFLAAHAGKARLWLQALNRFSAQIYSSQGRSAIGHMAWWVESKMHLVLPAVEDK